jgi:hypothetical protein
MGNRQTTESQKQTYEPLLTRKVNIMKTKLPSIATATLLSLAALAKASPTTITFDDLTTNTGTSSISGIPNGYQNLDWYNFYVAASDAYPGSNFASGIVSGDYAAIDGYGTTPSTITGGPFLLDSADLTSAWDTTDTVEVQGYLAGNPVFDTTVNLGPTASLTDFSSIDTTPVDTVNFTITGDPVNDNFAVDNLTVTEVPEPASMGVIGLASAAFLFRRRRSRTHTASLRS